MKVVLINGSPHAFGCTHTALSETARALQERHIETKLLHIGTKPIPGCLGCFRCHEGAEKGCVYKDLVNLYADKLAAADGMVFGSPVYFSSPNASMLAFLDRLYASSASRLSHKPCGCFVTARRAGTTLALSALHQYPLVNCQPLVASSYWCGAHGDTPEALRTDEEGLRIAYDLGQNLAWLLEAIQAGQRQGLRPPVME